MSFNVTYINYNYKENKTYDSINLHHKYCKRLYFENTVENIIEHEIIHQDDDNSLYYIFFTFR